MAAGAAAHPRRGDPRRRARRAAGPARRDRQPDRRRANAAPAPEAPIPDEAPPAAAAAAAAPTTRPGARRRSERPRLSAEGVQVGAVGAQPGAVRAWIADQAAHARPRTSGCGWPAAGGRTRGRRRSRPPPAARAPGARRAGSRPRCPRCAGVHEPQRLRGSPRPNRGVVDAQHAAVPLQPRREPGPRLAFDERRRSRRRRRRRPRRASAARRAPSRRLPGWRGPARAPAGRARRRA